MRTILCVVALVGLLGAGCSASLPEASVDPAVTEKPLWVRQSDTLHAMLGWADPRLHAKWSGTRAVVTNATEARIRCGVCAASLWSRHGAPPSPAETPAGWWTSISPGTSAPFDATPPKVIMCELDWQAAAAAVGMSGEELSRFFDDHPPPVEAPFSLSLELGKGEPATIDLNHRLFTSSDP